MFKRTSKLRCFGIKLISTNSAKRTTEALRFSKREDYYRNLGGIQEKNDVKPPEWDEALPYECIPGPKPLPLIGNTWRFLPIIGQYYNVPLLDLHKSLHKEYGNVVALKGVGRNTLTILFDVNDIEKMLRNEGAFPIRRGIDSLVHYRMVTKKDLFKGVGGLLVLQGEEWYKFRSVVNPILLQPRTAQQYVGNMDRVANELIENIRYFSTNDRNNEMPEGFQNELYKWAFESVGVIALGKHLGCLNLNAPKDSETQKLISCVNEMFLLLYKFEVLPPIWKIIETPTWKRFVKILNFITETLMKHIEEAMSKTAADALEHELSVTQKFLKHDKRLAVAMIMDMLVAGIDTTGKSMAAALYLLANNPDKQQFLREEVLKNLPEKNSPVTKEVLNNSPYLKAVIKETTRISPIGIGNARTSVKDMVLGGYRIPKGSEVIALNILTANSENGFKDAHKFIPERWLRTTVDDYSHKNANPFAYLPFGFGPRSCIGKRLANLELEVAISKIIRNFELSWHHESLVFGGNFLYGIQGPLRLRVKELK